MSFAMKGVALITGAASGMGAATVSAFVRQGVTRLAIADVQVSKLEAIASQVSASKSGIKILPITCDVADEESVKAMVKATVDTYGRIDYAVNCAGIMGQVAPAATASTELYRRTVGVNQDGIFFCMRAQLEQMDKQDLLEGPSDERRRVRGSIVNIGSVCSTVAVQNMFAYTASKHAVAGLTKVGAVDYGKRAIRVNNLAPGFIDTPMVHNEVTPEHQTHLPALCLDRMGRAEEIADVAVFLSSEGASYITGATVNVDGGYTVM